MHAMNETPKDLFVGTIYSEREIAIFISDKRDFLILCEDKSNFNLDNKDTKFEVLSAENTHIIAKTGMQVTHMNPLTKVYRIKMIMG